MPRSYARLLTSVWDDVDDNDWLGLTYKAKYLYFLLTTQSEISACGRLRLTVRSWATMSPDTDSATIAAALRELVEKRIVLADKDTEEVLVRSFVKDDGGFNNRKRIPVIRDAVREIRSRELRAAALVELERVGLSMGSGPDTDPDRASGRASDSASATPPAVTHQATVNGKRPAMAKTASSQVDSLSDSTSDSASDGPAEAASDSHSRSSRVAVVQVGGSTTQPTTHNQTSLHGKSNTTNRGTRIDPSFAVTDELRVWAAVKAPNVDLEFETEQFIDYWIAKPGAIACKLDWDRTWQTWIRKAQKTSAPRAGNVIPIRSTTDDRVAQALAAGAAVQAELDAQREANRDPA